MGSVNDWLGFSLSSQDHQTNTSSATAATQLLPGGVDVSDECFGLATDTSSASLSIPNLRQDGPFGFLESFNRSPQQPQDWSMKGLDFKGNSSELSVLVGSSSNQKAMAESVEPKLENFLGGNSFSDHEPKLPPGCNSVTGHVFDNSGDYIFSNYSMQFPEAAANGGGETMNSSLTAGNNSSIGLSMIKTWLRNQPAPPQLQESGGVVVGTGDGAGGSSSSAGALAKAQSLSLSMCTGSQSSNGLQLLVAQGPGGGESSSVSVVDNRQNGCGSSSLDGQSGAVEAVPRKSVETFGQRTSIYRGVTRHRWTGRYEAHLWDNTCRREGQTRKGRQVYLGGYDKEEKAARAYDLAALKYWGSTTTTNFPVSNYEKEMEEMKHMTRQEYIASLRRKSSGFSRGASIYRGVTRHHQHGRWQARIGRVAGNKDLYLGTFSTQEEAAEAYDIAAIKFRGLNAVTNFDMNRYDVKSILESSTLPIGAAAKRLKEASGQTDGSLIGRRTDNGIMTSQITQGINSYSSHQHHNGWPFSIQQNQPLSIHYPYGQQSSWCKQEQDSDDQTAVHGFQDIYHQLHLGSNTHNFLQPSVLHNLMGSNSMVYSGSGVGSTGSYQGVVDGSDGMPMSTDVGEHLGSSSSSSFGDNEVKFLGYNNMLGSAYHFNGRNMYHHQSHGGGLKTNGYDQSTDCNNSNNNNGIPSSLHGIASRSSEVSVCHGSPIFTSWNDT